MDIATYHTQVRGYEACIQHCYGHTRELRRHASVTCDYAISVFHKQSNSKNDFTALHRKTYCLPLGVSTTNAQTYSNASPRPTKRLSEHSYAHTIPWGNGNDPQAKRSKGTNSCTKNITLQACLTIIRQLPGNHPTRSERDSAH